MLTVTQRAARRALRLAPGAERRGATLLTVLAFSVVTLTIGASILSSGSYESRNAQQRLTSSKAFWLAEAGFQKLSAEAYNDASWLTANRNFSDTLSDGTYTLLIRDTTVAGLGAGITPYHVYSTGTVAGYNATSTRRLDLLVTVNSGGPGVNLGTASPSLYGLLTLRPTKVKMGGSSSVQGTVADIGVSNGDLSMNGATIVGKALVKSTNTVTTAGGSTIGQLVQDAATDATLAQAASDAIAASATYAAMSATIGTTVVSGNMTITGVAGVNVLNLTSLNLSNSILTLNAPANGVFVINDSGTFSVGSNSQILVTGGLQAGNVLFNCRGLGTLSTGSGAIVNGIILAPYRTTTIGGNSRINGAVMAGADSTTSNPTLDVKAGCIINGTGAGTSGSSNGISLAHWQEG